MDPYWRTLLYPGNPFLQGDKVSLSPSGLALAGNGRITFALFRSVFLYDTQVNREMLIHFV